MSNFLDFNFKNMVRPFNALDVKDTILQSQFIQLNLYAGKLSNLFKADLGPDIFDLINNNKNLKDYLLLRCANGKL